MGWSSSLPERIGDYRVLTHLGDGGMGSVLKAAAPDGRVVAVKIVRGEYACLPAFRERFCREAAAAARVPRFCTAEVLDYDVDGPTPFIVTEFIDGPTLQTSVCGGGAWQAADLDQLGVSVASALTAIHRAGVVHRDLKPANVLLSRAGPRVIDFGIARALDAVAGLTASGQPVGTPAFMSPEQCRGEEATPAVDVFAWGGLMVFAATARYPFGSGPAHVVSEQVQHADPDLSGLDSRLGGVVAAALSKDPAARPDAQELLGLLGVPGADSDPLPSAGRRLAGWVPPGSAAAVARLGESAARAARSWHVPVRTASRQPAAVSSTAVQTPPPVDVTGDLDLDFDLDLDLDGPATAEMPPVQELRAPRPVNRPVVGGGGSGESSPAIARTAGGPPTPRPAATADAASPPPAARTEPLRASVGRLLLVVGVLVMLAAVGIWAAAGLFGGDRAPTALEGAADLDGGQAPAVLTETYDLAVGAAVTTGSPAPGAGDLAKPDERELYAFEGIKGQKLFLTASSCEPTNGSSGFDPSWSLTDPSGQRLGFGALCVDPTVDPELPTLPVNGRYQLTVQTTDDATGRFSFLLSAPPELPGNPDGGAPAGEGTSGAPSELSEPAAFGG